MNISFGCSDYCYQLKVRSLKKPIREVGLFAGAARLPHYLGSDEYSAYILPLPYLIYCGETFRANRDGLKGILWSNDRRGAVLSFSDFMTRCMRAALNEAKMNPEQIDYISAHATATEHGDEKEAEAIRAVFGGNTPVSSLKGNLAHTLGASGAIVSGGMKCAGLWRFEMSLFFSFSSSLFST